MTLTTTAIIYYAIATPMLILMCNMLYVGGKDSKRIKRTRPSYDEALRRAHNQLTPNKFTTRLGSRIIK